MEDTRTTIVLSERKKLTVQDVSEVLSFQETQSEIQTALGRLQITGSGMHLEKLDLATGELILTGTIDSLYYPDDSAQEKKRLFSRFFS